MSGRYLLDTNAVIALIGGDVSTRDLVSHADAIFMSSPVLGELYFGAFRSGRVPENVERIDNLVRWYSILRIDESTARLYGLLRQQLGAAGQPIPNNDIWIAALAQQHGAMIVTRDSHFDAVENLAVIRWSGQKLQIKSANAVQNLAEFCGRDARALARNRRWSSLLCELDRPGRNCG